MMMVLRAREKTWKIKFNVKKIFIFPFFHNTHLLT
jgi:hypothetical protein